MSSKATRKLYSQTTPLKFPELLLSDLALYFDLYVQSMKETALCETSLYVFENNPGCFSILNLL